MAVTHLPPDRCGRPLKSTFRSSGLELPVYVVLLPVDRRPRTPARDRKAISVALNLSPPSGRSDPSEDPQEGSPCSMGPNGRRMTRCPTTSATARPMLYGLLKQHASSLLAYQASIGSDRRDSSRTSSTPFSNAAFWPTVSRGCAAVSAATKSCWFQPRAPRILPVVRRAVRRRPDAAAENHCGLETPAPARVRSASSATA